MDMWCPDGIGRDSWVRVEAGSREVVWSILPKIKGGILCGVLARRCGKRIAPRVKLLLLLLFDFCASLMNHGPAGPLASHQHV